jgi:hypothetical protein
MVGGDPERGGKKADMVVDRVVVVETGRMTANGRPRKTQEELDAEMEDCGAVRVVKGRKGRVGRAWRRTAVLAPLRLPICRMPWLMMGILR